MRGRWRDAGQASYSSMIFELCQRTDGLMAPMKPDVVNNTLKYFDDFYATINDPRRTKRQILDACLGGSA